MQLQLIDYPLITVIATVKVRTHQAVRIEATNKREN